MKTHVTVVPADGIILVDGQALHFAYPHPPELHAVQWHEGTGHVEWADKANQALHGEAAYAEFVAPFVAQWEAEKARLETENPLPPPLPPVTPTLADVHAAKLAEIIAGSNACAALVKSRYSALEIDSWPLQEAQAERVLAGESIAPDALLVVLAAANGVSVQDFAARVLNNVTTAEALTKIVVSTQQGYEHALKHIMADSTLDDAGKMAAIQAVDVVYSLPDA